MNKQVKEIVSLSLISAVALILVPLALSLIAKVLATPFFLSIALCAQIAALFALWLDAIDSAHLAYKTGLGLKPTLIPLFIALGASPALVAMVIFF